MTVSESTTESTLFDRLPTEAPADRSASSGTRGKSVAEIPEKQGASAEGNDVAGAGKGAAAADDAGNAEHEAGEAEEAQEAAEDSENAEGMGSQEPPESPEVAARNERKRIEEQLLALKRKEAELRGALLATDHPELANAIGDIRSRANAVNRAEEQLAQGMSKKEARRRDALEKKLSSLRTKRAELDEQIGTLEQEYAELGMERRAQYEAEREEAMQRLMAALGSHADSLKDAGVDPKGLVPELEGWWSELQAIAARVSGSPQAESSNGVVAEA